MPIFSVYSCFSKMFILFSLFSFYVCQGAYDPGLINAWEDWDARHSSENDHPKEFTEKQVSSQN